MSTTRSRITMTVLVLSLALNLVLVGGMIGRFMMGPPHRSMPEHLGWMLRGLDADRRAELRPDIVAHARKVLPLRREMRDAQEAFEAVLLDPEMSEKQLEAALDRVRNAFEAYQAASHEEMVTVLKQLDADERKQVVSYLHRHRPGRDERREHGERRGPDMPPDDGPPPPDGD